MNRNNIFAWVLLLTFSLFIIFNYMPSMIKLSALETENKIYMQLEGKVKELEARFTEPQVKDVAVKATSIETRRQLEKQVRPAEIVKEAPGKRRPAMRQGKPMNPFNPDY